MLCRPKESYCFIVQAGLGMVNTRPLSSVAPGYCHSCQCINIVGHIAIGTRIAAAFNVSGDRLISRIQYRTFAGNSIPNVDHVTVRHPTTVVRSTQAK